MNIISSFPLQLFSSQIPDVELTTAATRIVATISFGSPAVEIYNERLYPDISGRITITELSALITPYARRQLIGTLSILLMEQTVTKDGNDVDVVTDGDTQQLSSQIIYSTALVDSDAETFCSTHFLTRLQGPKTTAIGRLEYLHYAGNDQATVEAFYDDGTSMQFAAQVVGGNGSYTTINVSPAQYIAAGKEIYQFVVTAGQRSQTFRIDFNAPDAAPILLFTNCFGCQELIYCTGTHTVAPKFNYSSVFIGDKLKTYDIEETRNFKADTGVLTFPMADWLSDLFRSDEIYLVNFFNGSPMVGREIAISDQDSEYSNNADSLPRFTFTYRYAQRNQNVIGENREGRIFDNTFDFTFN